MLAYARHLPVLALYLLVIGMHFWMWRALTASLRRRAFCHGAFLLAAALLTTGFLLGFNTVIRMLPQGEWMAWVRAAAMTWSLVSLGLASVFWVWRHTPAFRPSRRRVLRAASLAAASAPVFAGGFGALVERSVIRAREVELRFPELPPDLDGLRLAQLTDIHLGPFLSEKELASAVAIANEFQPHLSLVTGDLISERSDPLDACLRLLSGLRAEVGTYGCLGNHEGYAGVEAYAAAEGQRLGIRFLRNQRQTLRFGAGVLNLAGVDYQKMGGPYLQGLEWLHSPGAFNLLLSHNPDVFPVASRHGHQLVVAGHTHGGQVNLEVFGFPFNVAELYTPFVYGIYHRPGALLWVSRGIGTVGIPVRFGAPPEVALIRLTR
ncbi:MAG: metallophosphoesterase [Bryobacteraceae bacterium]